MRRSYAILIIVLTFPARAPGQQEATVDAPGAVGKLKSADTMEIDTMIASVSRQMKRENPDRALNIFREACELSRSIGYSAGISRALNGIGSVYSLKGHNEHALQFAEKSIEAAMNLASGIEFVDALNLKGSALAGLARNKEAVEVYARALDIAEQIGAAHAVSSILNNTGSSLFYLGRHADAIEFWKRSLNIDEKSGDSSRMCGTLMNIGNAQSTPELALLYYRKALALAEKIDDGYTTAFTLSQMSGVLVEQGRIEEAIFGLERGLKIAQEIDNQYLKYLITQNLGSAYKTKLDPDRAFRYFRIALEISVQLQNPAAIATASAGLASTVRCGATKPAQIIYSALSGHQQSAIENSGGRNGKNTSHGVPGRRSPDRARWSAGRILRKEHRLNL